MPGRHSDGRPRVLILHPEDVVGPTIGGVSTFIRDFVRFAPEDLSVEVVGATSDTFERPVGRWFDWEVGSRTARYLPLVKGTSTSRHSRIPVVLRYVAALLARRHPIVMEGRTLQFHRAEVPLAFPRSSRPRLQVIHVDVQLGNRENRWRYLPGFYRRVEDLTIGSMDRVYVANERGARFYQQRHPWLAERVSFLSGWYDDSLFRPIAMGERAARRASLASRLGFGEVSPQDRLLLFVGRLEEQKDPRLLIETFAELLRSGRGAEATGLRLVVIGEGSLQADAEAWARDLGVANRISFMAAQPHEEIARLMPAFDVLLLPSRWEGGGPRVVLEAMASGLPVVATVVGEVERVVRTGVNGWLVRTPSAVELAEGVRWVLTQPFDAVSAAAVEAVQPFAATRVLATLYEAHRELTLRGHGG